MDSGQPSMYESSTNGYENELAKANSKIKALEYELRRAEHEAEGWRKKYLEVVEMYNDIVKSLAK